MKTPFLIHKIRHLIYKNTEWTIPNDLELNDLKGKVKFLSSYTSVLSKNKSDTSWANEIIADNNFEKIFNPYGFLIQETKIDEGEKIKNLYSYEYGNSIGFCEKEVFNKFTKSKIILQRNKYLFSKNAITKWRLTSIENLKDTVYLFDSDDNLKTIKTYLNYQMPITGEIQKRPLESIEFNKRKKVSSIFREKSLSENLFTHFYVNNNLERIEVKTKFRDLNYEKKFLYDKSNFLETIIWLKDGKQFRKDSLINNRKGNWVERNIEISNEWKIRITRNINYYMN